MQCQAQIVHVASQMSDLQRRAAPKPDEPNGEVLDEHFLLVDRLRTDHSAAFSSGFFDPLPGYRSTSPAQAGFCGGISRYQSPRFLPPPAAVARLAGQGDQMQT